MKFTILSENDEKFYVENVTNGKNKTYDREFKEDFPNEENIDKEVIEMFKVMEKCKSPIPEDMKITYKFEKTYTYKKSVH